MVYMDNTCLQRHNDLHGQYVSTRRTDLLGPTRLPRHIIVYWDIHTATSNCYRYCNFKLQHVPQLQTATRTLVSNCYTHSNFKLLHVLQLQTATRTPISNCYTHSNFKLLHALQLQTAIHTATSNCYKHYSFKLLYTQQLQTATRTAASAPTRTGTSKSYSTRSSDVLEVQGDKRTGHSRYCNYRNLNEGAIRIPSTR